MRNGMMIAVVALALGCGPDDRSGAIAPPECPVATEMRIDVAVQSVVGEPDSIYFADVTARTEDGDEGQSRHIGTAQHAGKRETVASFRAIRDTRLEISLGWRTKTFGPMEPADSRTITLDRNCDLLVEIAQSGEDPPRIDDVRWIPRDE